MSADQPASPVRVARTARKRPDLSPYLFIAPALCMVAAVSVIPIVQAVFLSLNHTSFLNITGFAGLANYAQLMRSGEFWSDVVRSAIYVFASLALVVPLGVTLAMVLNRPLRYRSFFRTIVLLPWVVSQTIAALLWKWGLNPYYGPFTAALASVGGHQIDPLSDPTQAMATLIVVNVWLAYPFVVILVLAALQGLPREVLEAARVDGASGLDSFVHITLPLISGTLLIVIIMLTLLFFNMVTLVYTLTAGGPFTSTETLSLRAFVTSFQFFNFGLGAALAAVLFIFNVVFSVLYVRLIRTDAYS